MPHFAYLDGIRGLLALYVLCHHFLGLDTSGLGPAAGLTATVFRFGRSAVSVFIVLSGYSLMLPVVAAPGRGVRGGFRGYLVRRARRILPPYYASLVLSVLAVLVVARLEGPGGPDFGPDDLSAGSLLTHLTLVHNWTSAYAHSLNQALWSVATEWQIYFLFPTVLLPVWQRFGPWALLASAFGIGLLPTAFVSGPVLPAASPWYLGLFAIGMTAAAVTARPDHVVRRHPSLGLFLPAASALLYLGLGRANVVTSGNSLQWLKDATIGWIAWWFLIDCSAIFPAAARGWAGGRPWVMRLLESKPVVVLGTFSYSLYATHCAILRLCHGLAARAHLAPEASWLFRGVVGVPLALVVAYTAAQWFEVPFLRPRTRTPEPPPLSTAVAGVGEGGTAG